jgi:DNA polymerase (family 10)
MLARASSNEEDGERQRALRRASLAALSWPDEVADLAAQGRAFTELRTVGPWIASRIGEWLEHPPEVPEPPPSRRGWMSLAEARRTIADHPEWRASIRADLQVHTTESDGAASIEVMLSAAAELGHERIAITDHSRTLRVTRGMDERRLLAQGRAIEALNERLGREGARTRVLKGIEMDLTPEGAGDMDPAALATLDVVLGAFHSQLRTTEDQTERYLRALDNPTIDVLAHPRTKMWNRRDGLNADWRRVAERAAARGVALEIDGAADREDLDVATLRTVSDVDGLWFAIDTDAHHPDELVFIDIGVATAIRGGVRRDRVINLLGPDDLETWVRERRRRRGSP